MESAYGSWRLACTESSQQRQERNAAFATSASPHRASEVDGRLVEIGDSHSIDLPRQVRQRPPSIASSTLHSMHMTTPQQGQSFRWSFGSSAGVQMQVGIVVAVLSDEALMRQLQVPHAGGREPST